jgi:serine/threonine protein kinase
MDDYSLQLARTNFKWGSWDNYSVERTLGRGGEGCVKLAIHKEKHQMVAIKILKRKDHASRALSLFMQDNEEEKGRSDEAPKYHDNGRQSYRPRSCIEKNSTRNDELLGIMLPRELIIHQHLHHPHVVTLLEVVQRNGEFREVLEYCSRGSITAILSENDRKPFTVSETQMIFRQLMSGVSYLHACGITHRDLKPDNLLMNAGGVMKISDFGVSEVFRTADGQPRELLGAYGTDAYMAPEMVQGRPYHGESIDIWSCGVILLTLLLGRPVWSIADVGRDEMFREFYEKGLERFGFEKKLDELLRSMLKLDPIERLSAREILEHEWCTRVCFDSHRYLSGPLPKLRQFTRTSRKFTQFFDWFSFRRLKRETPMAVSASTSSSAKDVLTKLPVISQSDLDHEAGEFVREPVENRWSSSWGSERKRKSDKSRTLLVPS